MSNRRKDINFFWKKFKRYPDLVRQLKSNSLIVNSIPENIRKQITAYQVLRPTTKLELLLDSVHNVDQEARRKCPRNLDKNCQAQFIKVDNSNIKYVAGLIKDIHFSEAIYGEDCLKTIFLVGLHARRWGYTDMDSTLFKWVQSGYTKPSYLAQLVTYRSDLDSVNKCCISDNVNLGFGATTWVLGNHLLEFNQYDSTIARINYDRQRYLMDDVKRDVNKQFLVLTNRFFKNSSSDFNLEFINMQVSEQEFKSIYDDLVNKKVIKRKWLWKWQCSRSCNCIPKYFL